MPDKIKEVYELISNDGYFKDENEFRQYVSDPNRRKEAFELIKDNGYFTDENEFNSYFDGEPQKKNETPKIPSKQPLPKGADSFSNVWRPALQSKSPSSSGGSTEFLAILNNIKSEVGKPQTPPKPTGDAYTDRLVKRAKRGLDQLNVGLMKAPEFIYNIAAIPQNVVAEKFDIPELATSAERVKKDLGINNEAAEYYKNQVNQLAYLDSKYDKPVTELISSGNYGDAARLLGEQIFESLPTTIALAASGGMGATSTAMTLGGGAVFGANEYDAMGDVDMPESEKVAIALSKGMLEGLIENMGTVGLGRLAKGVVEKQGKEAGKQIVKQSFIDAYTEGLKKYMPISGAIQESIEEGATQFANNAIDKFTGVNPNVSLTDGVLDNMLVGLGSGAVISAPISLIANRSKEIEQKAKEIDAIDSDIQKENVSEDTKAVLNNERQKKMSEINDILKEETDYQKTLPIEVKEKIDDLSDNVEIIEASLAEDISDESRKIFETQKADILKEIEELKNAGTNTIEQPIEGGVVQPTTTPQGDSGVIEEGVTETNIQTEVDEKAQTEKAEVGVLDSDTALPTDGSPAAETGVVQGDVKTKKADIEKSRQEELSAVKPVETNEEVVPTLDELLTVGNKIVVNGSQVTIEDGGNKLLFKKSDGELASPAFVAKSGLKDDYVRENLDYLRYQNAANKTSTKKNEEEIKRINAKYDAELKAVEELLGQKTSPSVQAGVEAGVEAGSVVGGEVVKGTKVADKEGNPVVVYHGSGRGDKNGGIIEKFDESMVSKNEIDFPVNGFFFAGRKGEAQIYGGEKNTGSYYVDIKNPASRQDVESAVNEVRNHPDYDKDKGEYHNPTLVRKILIEKGFDGYIPTPFGKPNMEKLESGDVVKFDGKYFKYDKAKDEVLEFDDRGNAETLGSRDALDVMSLEDFKSEYSEKGIFIAFKPEQIHPVKAVEQSLKETPAKQELAPPVVEQTTTDEGGVTTPTVSQEGLPLTVDSKQERKDIAKARIDEIADALKDFLPKADLPKGTKQSGLTQDNIIDMIASAVKQLVSTGIDVETAIKQVVAKLSEKFDTKSIDIKRVKDKVYEKENKQASGLGWDNAPQAINSINKRLGTDYKTWESIPKHVKEFVSSFRNAVEKQKTDFNVALKAAYKYLDMAVKDGEITREEADNLANMAAERATPKTEKKGTLAEGVSATTQLNQADFKNQKVSMLKAMREKFNSFFKGEKKGAKEKLALIESLNTEFKNYIKESGFDDQKIRKVLKYFGKINTIQKLNKALLEMDKMIEDREYLDKVIEAQSLKEKVKAKLKTNKKSFGNYYNKAKDFSGINPSSILDTELLDLYIKIAKDLTNTVIPKIESLKEVQAIYDKVQKNDEIKSLKDETLGNSLEGSTLVEKIANAIEKMEELEITNIKDVRAFRRLYQYAYNKNLELTSGIANLNEIDSIEETAIENDKKLEELKEKFGELLKDFSDELVDSINTSKEDFTLRNAMSLFPEFENDLIYFYNDIKPLDLGLIDLELYKAILDGMESGFINDQLTSFVRRHKAQKIAESALSDFIESIPFEEKRATLIQKLKSPLLGKELENFSGNETAKVVKYLISQYPSEIDRFLGLNDTFWNKVWNPINRAYTQWVSDYEERLVDFRKTIGRFNEKDQRVTAIAMKQMDYIDNMTQEIRDNLRKQAIKYFESKNKTEPTQADLAKIEDGLNDWFYTMTELIPTKTVEYDITEDVKAYKVAKRAIGADGKVDVKKLDTKYQKAIEKSREVLDALAPLAKYNTLSDGKQWEERVSYFPSFTKSEMLGVVENDFDKLLKSGDVTKFVGYTSGSTFKRVDDVFYINLNLNNQVSSAIKEVTKQYHMKGAVNSSLGGLRRMMGNEQIATSKNRKKISLALYHTTRKLLAAQFVQNYVSNIFDKISGNLKLSILSSIYRPMLETATAIPKAMFVTRDLTLPYQVIKLAFNRTFPKYESEMSKAITGFSGGHKGLINEYTSAAEKVSKQAMELTSASSRSQLAKFAKWWVSVAESIISPAVFYRQLVKEYKKETGKLFDAEKYNKDKDYQIEVRSVMEKIAPKLERVLEDAVVVQSKINSPVTFMFGKIEKGSKVSGIYNILNPFTSVIAKERVLFRKGLYEISNGDYVGGLSKVGAVFANAYLYSLMSQIAISKTTVYTAMLSQYLLQSLGDDDEDDEEMMKMLKAMEQAGEQRFEEMWDLDTQMYQAIGSFFAGAIGEYAYLLRPALALVIANVLKSDEELRVDTIKKQKILKAVNSSGIINVNKNLNYSDVSDYAKAYLGLGATLVDDLQGVLDTYELTTEKKNLLKKDMAVFTGYSTALAIAQTLHPAPLSQDFKRSLDQMARMSNPMYATNFIEAASMQRATKMLEALNEINEKENKKYKTLNEIPKSTLANYDSYKEISVVDERFNKMLNTGILFKFEPNYNKNMTEFEKKQRVERLNKKHRSSYINTSEKMLERVSETPSTLEKIDKEFEKAKDKATLLFESITARDK